VRIGINTCVFPANITLPQGLRIAKGAGFDCIELNISADGYLTPDSTQSDAEKLRSAAENMSLEVTSIVAGMLWQYPLTANEPATAEMGKKIVRKGLELAKWLGADTLLVVPGLVTADVPYGVAYERSKEAILELAKEAERLEVHIGVENVWNKFLLSPLEMARFIDEIDSPFVGAYFDVGNVLATGFPQHWISILGPRIRKVHVKDFQTNIGNITGFANICQGDVDWMAVKKALKQVGYDDVVTAEISGYKTLPELGIRHAAESRGDKFLC